MAQENEKPSLEELIPDPDRRKDIINRLYKGDKLIGEDGIFTDMLQAMVNAALEGEMDAHLSKEKSEGKSNRRNGKLSKKLKSNSGPLEVDSPRDRDGSFEPALVGKWKRTLNTGFDEAIIHLYARGNSVEDIRHQLAELYGVEVSASAISAVTARVMETATEWQQRPLAQCYPIVFLDAVHFKVRSEGKVTTKAVYTVYGVDVEGQRDVLGLYMGEAEGAHQWGLILEDLQKRGVEDVFFFCIDGLTGFKEVIEEVFPKSQVQRCIVHMIRSSTRFVSYKDLKSVNKDLRTVYTATNRQEAAMALETFGEKWNKKYPEISKKWNENWEELMTFMDWKKEIRRMIYTTNPVEALHRIMRRVTKSKGAWINEKALFKQLYLALSHSEKSWKKTAYNWSKIKKELYDHFGERYEQYIR